MRWRAALVAAVGVAVVAALAVLPDGRGPLTGGIDRTRITFPVDPDVPFTWGYVGVRNTAAEPAILRRIALVDATAGIEIVGVKVVPLREAPRGGVANSRDFPPAKLAGGPLHDLDGFAVLPHRGDPSEDVWVVLGLAVRGEGVYDVVAVEIGYTVGRRAYTDRYPHALRVCSPISAYERCPPAGELP